MMGERISPYLELLDRINIRPLATDETIFDRDSDTYIYIYPLASIYSSSILRMMPRHWIEYYELDVHAARIMTRQV